MCITRRIGQYPRWKAADFRWSSTHKKLKGVNLVRRNELNEKRNKRYVGSFSTHRLENHRLEESHKIREEAPTKDLSCRTVRTMLIRSEKGATIIVYNPPKNLFHGALDTSHQKRMLFMPTPTTRAISWLCCHSNQLNIRFTHVKSLSRHKISGWFWVIMLADFSISVNKSAADLYTS